MLSQPRILVVDRSRDLSERLLKPLAVAGLEPLVRESFAGLAGELRSLKPAFVIAGAESVFSDRGDASDVETFRAALSVPLLVAGDERVDPAILERVHQLGADDFLFDPLRPASLRARMDALDRSARKSEPERRRAMKKVLVISPEAPETRPLREGLERAGYHVSFRDPVDGLIALPGAELCVFVAAHVEEFRGVAKTLQAHAGFDARALRVVVPENAVAGSLDPSQLWRLPAPTVGNVLPMVDAHFRRNSAPLRVDQRVPFFCPVEFRLSEGAQASWSSGYAYELSPGGLFVNTLCAPPAGAAVEFRLRLPAGPLQGQGISAWSNGWGDKRPFSAPTGMAVQFLGMDAGELGRLRKLCAAPGVAAAP